MAHIILSTFLGTQITEDKSLAPFVPGNNVGRVFSNFYSIYVTDKLTTVMLTSYSLATGRIVYMPSSKTSSMHFTLPRHGKKGKSPIRLW